MMRRLGISAFLFGLAGHSAFAQCVMCFRTAAAQQSERARVLNAGILIMLIPPVLILSGFMLLFYLRRKTYSAPDTAEPRAEINASSFLENTHGSAINSR